MRACTTPQKAQYVTKLPSGLNQADTLCEESARLDRKYAALLDAWIAKHVGTADVIAGAGGEIVMVNLMYVANQPVASTTGAGALASARITLVQLVNVHHGEPCK